MYDNVVNSFILGLPRNKVCIVMEALLWHIFIQGLLQPSLALMVSFVICPLASLVVFLGNILLKIIFTKFTLFYVFQYYKIFNYCEN